MWGGLWGGGARGRGESPGGSPEATVLVLSTVSDARTTRVRGRGELSPSKLSTILSTLPTMQYSLLCSGRTTSSICIVVSTMQSAMQQSPPYYTLYLESLLTITFSLPRSSHFLTITFTFSSLPLSRYCSSRVLTFSI